MSIQSKQMSKKPLCDEDIIELYWERDEKADEYDTEAAELKDAINEHLYDEKCGMYFSADVNLEPIKPRSLFP